jgi:phosphopantothenoylcysteine decarboxylase/phosphopantothenate--cysteine ligase
VAAQRGAEVTLIAAHTVALPEPAGVTVHHVSTAEQLRRAVHEAAKPADVVVMAAAVADFRPVNSAGHKIKKSEERADPAITLERTVDILSELVANRVPGQVLVGFAAETGDERGTVLDHGRAKLRQKSSDLLVVNAVGDGKAFEMADNGGWLLSADGTERPIPFGAKSQLAAAVWDAVVGLLRH